MTKREAQATCDKILALAKEDPNMYIKGYGETKSRVMSSDHKPIMNIPKSLAIDMLFIGKIKKDGLIYKFV
jgi:hypothetical protein